MWASLAAGRCLGFVLVSIAVLAADVAGAAPRTETRSYVGGTAIVHGSCEASGDGVSRVCIPLDGTEQSVRVTIVDDTGLRVRGEWEFVRPDGGGPGRTFFCEEVAVPVPDDVTTLRVHIHALTNTASCTTVADGVGGPGTTGVVIAAFE